MKDNGSPSADDWRQAYRSQDMAGSEHAAGRVAWDWINEVAIEQQCENPDFVAIEQAGSEGGGMTIMVYCSTDLLAAAHVFRDAMNFSVLIRWKSPAILSEPSS